MTFDTSMASAREATSSPMEGPKTKGDVVAMPAVRARLRRWARCTLWVAATSLILLDCGMHALLRPVASADVGQLENELRNVATPVQGARGNVAGRDDNLYLPPGLRSGSFE